MSNVNECRIKLEYCQFKCIKHVLENRQPKCRSTNAKNPYSYNELGVAVVDCHTNYIMLNLVGKMRQKSINLIVWLDCFYHFNTILIHTHTLTHHIRTSLTERSTWFTFAITKAIKCPCEHELIKMQLNAKRLDFGFFNSKIRTRKRITAKTNSFGVWES